MQEKTLKDKHSAKYSNEKDKLQEKYDNVYCLLEETRHSSADLDLEAMGKHLMEGITNSYNDIIIELQDNKKLDKKLELFQIQTIELENEKQT